MRMRKLKKKIYYHIKVFPYKEVINNKKKVNYFWIEITYKVYKCSSFK